MLSTGISVAHSNDAIARTLQEPSPRLVVASLRFSIVHVSLELDHNPFTGAIEIRNKAVQYVLSPKLEPEDSAVAQLAGARKSLGRAETTKRIHLPERAAQRNDLRNQNPAERSEKKLTLRSPSPGGRGGQGVRTGTERGSGGEDCGHSVGAVHRCLDVSDARRAMNKPGHGICAEKKMDVSSFMDDETRLRGSRSGKQAWARPNDVL